MSVNINTQIVKLRKEKGVTQEELAKAVGVTNQSVSKWESATCCPDIQLLPVLADYFGVTIDELMGRVNNEVSIIDAISVIKKFVGNSDPDMCVRNAYVLATSLHEASVLRGILKGYSFTSISTDYYDSVSYYSSSGGEMICTGNVVACTNHNKWELPEDDAIGDICTFLGKCSRHDVLKVMFAIYELTMNDINVYASIADISKKARLSEEQVSHAMKVIKLKVMNDDDGDTYRLDDKVMFVPPMLLLLYNSL